MGLEATCRARLGKEISAGRARLEEKELVFVGAFRLRIPFAEVRSVEAKGGWLRLRLDRGVAGFDLGPAAEKWALKIRYPRPRIDKIGVKPGSRVSVLGDLGADFEKELRGRTMDVALGRARADSDLVLVAMEEVKDLGRLKALRTSIKKDGAIWVVWPKGRKQFREDDVRAAGAVAGLVDVKVMSFSDTLSALKMMIPRAQR